MEKSRDEARKGQDLRTLGNDAYMERQRRKRQLGKRTLQKKQEPTQGLLQQEKPQEKTLPKFQEQCRTLLPDRGRKALALAEIRQAAEQKTVWRMPALGELVWTQLQYISPAFWIIQGILVAALALLLAKTSMDQGALADYLQWASVMAAWMGVAGCGSLGRHFAKGMAELEQSCYFNLSQMWTIKMALSGTLDILALTFCSGQIAERTSVPFGQVCLYVLVPFVLANVCCLFFLTAFRGGRSRYGQLVLTFVTGLMASVPALLPLESYTGTFLWAWGAVLLGGIGLYLWQLRHMYGKIRRGEMVCWN